MGPHRAARLIVLLGLVTPLMAQAPGWRFSPLPGEGDRAAMGCDRNASADSFTCLAVRCEDDFSIGLHVYSSRRGGDAGLWDMTLDREDRSLRAEASSGPYGARFVAEADFLLDRLRHGTFVYLRHSEDQDAPFAYIDLSGSMAAIAEALYWCAPRVVPDEQKTEPGVDPDAAKQE